MNYCVIVPTFNNDQSLRKVLLELLKVTSDIIVVNDGSTDNTPIILKDFKIPHVISYPENRGKGYALKKGFEYAVGQGFQYAITIDADGQHNPEDIRLFINEVQQNPDSLVVGARDLQKIKLSRGSRFANRFSNFWFRFIAGLKIPDTQSGFRLYPLRLLKDTRFYTNRYEFEVEILVRSAWKRIPIKSIPVEIYYPEKENRVSHFRPYKDFMRISLLNTVLVFVALFYIKPFYFVKYLRKDTIIDFLRKQIIQTRDSTVKTTLSVMFGVFMGVVPIWGYQLVTAIALAYLFRLNKFIVIVTSNISIPPMIPFILYGSYITGGWILQLEHQRTYGASDINFEFVKNNLYQYVIGSLVFAVILSVCFGFVTFLALKLFRKKTVLID